MVLVWPILGEILTTLLQLNSTQLHLTEGARPHSEAETGDRVSIGEAQLKQKDTIGHSTVLLTCRVGIQYEEW